MYTLLFHKPEHIQMLMRPVCCRCSRHCNGGPPPHYPKPLPTCAPLNASVRAGTSFHSPVGRVCAGILDERLEAAGKTRSHLLI